ncbi:glycine/D-amino acid oxidase-like deaminating enzyme [Loktanella ponticola]|uniref:Glycine/D-amino acid oxidase-like deaminating enzyme n=1 Tax=Yoonia ponticola TaxID=1524255 RepID=A0A7W9EY40_9RHOB|nr:FAD-binding oxidoreductase [Yoonia ponticola]MBB5722347.1 glycine/D-amino acid oxidase-like deaminating enzyme [Yoonia ponticola]
MTQTPKHSSYDIVIVGGAMMGSSTAWFLSTMAGFQGRVLVVEMDSSYANSSTAHSNSCMRQQFSNEINVRISQFAADFVKNLRSYMGGDPRVPDLTIQNYGYLYLSDNDALTATLRENQKVQLAAGAETELLGRNEILERYPFYQLDDIQLGSINRKDEGYWDGGTVFDWWRRGARDNGVEYISNKVVAMEVQGGRVQSVKLESGDVIACGQVVNASGPRAALTAKMAGISLPVEPRKRFTWIFNAQTPLDRDLPLTIDPSGIHMRQDGPTTYLAGAAPDAEDDLAVDPTDFAMDHARWENHVWPIIATRIPQFEAIKVVTEWTGHYAYNTLDQNAVIGAHPEVTNFMFLNGFSGHGLQQSPAMGRAMAELLTYGEYRTLDMTPFAYERVLAGEKFIEKAVI